jgi:hypothetical protein
VLKLAEWLVPMADMNMESFLPLSGTSFGLDMGQPPELFWIGLL